MMNDDEPRPEAEPDGEDTNTLSSALGRTIGGAVVIFLLLMAVGAVAWLIFK
ncbi:MAG TPA: hypothetical protein VET48_09110 [Steroidobacteraceae bacterium]|nr:hypothetical protein [Steroidobacteraceae bacterium]